ncbi:sensor histidine kinase [Hydrogenimonas sp.]
MIFDKRRFALKYALIYGSIVGVVMLVPLMVYTRLMLGIHEAKTQNALMEQARNIVLQMESYPADGSEPFRFPRYAGFQGGLYDANMRPVFTLVPFTPPGFAPGYHTHGDYRYYVLPLPEGRYFGARYLVVSTRYDPSGIYLVALLVAGGIFATLLLLTWAVFRNFARPFEEVNRRLDDFIKDSMHEINTPLSIIQVNADLFARKYGSNRYIPRIKAAAKTLATIYNDMDYLVKKERMTYPKERIDFTKFLLERVDYFREVASLKEVAIETEVDAGVFVEFNPVRLQRIVDNTLSNAIKYSHEKGRVRVRLLQKGDDVLFEVADEGVGMKEPGRVFERFYREDRDRGGFGIGLHIVKQIVEREGVGIEVASTYGEGSRFTYTFHNKSE